MTETIEKKVDAGPCVIHCLAAGDPKCKAVLLLHGMRFQAETWRELATLEYLAEAGYYAVALDMPGFGNTPECATESATVLEDFIKQEKLEQPVLVGPSMGGRTSLEFTLDHPDLVGGLVLVGAVGVEENRDRLAEIKAPCLVVWGGNDTVAPLDNGRLLHDTIQGSQLLVIDDAPHPCYLEQPDVWHQELLAFLNGSFN